ncbi:MAG: hypothetical protein AAF125_11475 [Chloroflexota bacterium]
MRDDLREIAHRMQISTESELLRLACQSFINQMRESENLRAPDVLSSKIDHLEIRMEAIGYYAITAATLAYKGQVHDENWNVIPTGQLLLEVQQDSRRFRETMRICIDAIA